VLLLVLDLIGEVFGLHQAPPAHSLSAFLS
jgi:hypothetical protein